MNKTIIKTGSFTDFQGNERKFVMAAVSINEYTVGVVEDTKDEFYSKDCDDITLSKTVSLGISVCRPGDDFDEEMGVRIAIGKATAWRKHCLMTSDSGMINTAVVEALLEQECEYFKENPGRYLAGYDKDKYKYELAKAESIKAAKAQAFIDSLNEEQKKAYDQL